MHRFDGELPQECFHEVMDYIEMSNGRFLELCEQFRSLHLWKRENREWKLRYQVD